MNFMDDYLAGRTDGGDINDYIEAWHQARLTDSRALHEFLGMTWQQYGRWFEDDELPERGAP